MTNGAASGVIEGAMHQVQQWNAEAGIEPPPAETPIIAYAEATKDPSVPSGWQAKKLGHGYWQVSKAHRWWTVYALTNGHFNIVNFRGVQVSEMGRLGDKILSTIEALGHPDNAGLFDGRTP